MEDLKLDVVNGAFTPLESLEQGSGLTPNVSPDAFAVAPEFDCTEELRVEIDDTYETRPVRYTSDIRLILHTKDLASRAGLAVASKWFNRWWSLWCWCFFYAKCTE